MLIAVQVGICQPSGRDLSTGRRRSSSSSLHSPRLDRLLFSYYFGSKLSSSLSAVTTTSSPRSRCGGPADWAYHLVLPWLTFAALRGDLHADDPCRTCSRPRTSYVRTARAKGASEAVILRSHILRNASLPIVTMLAMDLGVARARSSSSGSTDCRGSGRCSPRARRNDLPVVLAIFVLISLTIVIFNLIVDIVYAKLDPRVSLQATDHEGTIARESRRGSAATRKRHRRRSLRRQPSPPRLARSASAGRPRRLFRALRRPRRESRSGARARCTARR